MKNILIVDIDTEREKQIMLGKGKDFIQPNTKEEEEQMMINDIQTLVDALNHLLMYAGKDDLRPQISEFLLNNKIEDIGNEE